jgi:hypothetical protein
MISVRPFLPSFLFLLPLTVIAAAQSKGVPDAPQPLFGVSPATAEDPPNYTRPSNETLFHVYKFDLFGPYPIFVSAATAGLHQAENAPSAWGQGVEGYAIRFGSSFGIGAVETTTRYALAKVVREDTLYYECDCKGFGRRLRHAVISSFTGRRGDDGHRVLSFASIAAPYAGTLAATYIWYPRSYGAGDAFRMGTYGLLGYVGGNISLEFLYGGPHSLLAHAHIPIPTNSANPSGGSSHN